MSTHKYALTTILLILMLGGVVLLGVMQYRWIGQVAQLENQRMRISLQETVRQFRDNFNLEVTVLWQIFHFNGSEPLRGNPRDAVIERYDTWRKHTRFPDLIAEVYIIRGMEKNSVETILKKSSENLVLETDPQVFSNHVFGEIFSASLGYLELSKGELFIPIFKDLEENMGITLLNSQKTRIFRRVLSDYSILIKLDMDVLKSQVLPYYVDHFFGKDAHSQQYSVTVYDSSNKAILYPMESRTGKLTGYYDAVSKVLSPVSLTRIEALPDFMGDVALPKGLGTPMLLSWLSNNTDGESIKDEIRENITKFEQLLELQDGEGGATGWYVGVVHEAGSLEAAVYHNRIRNSVLAFGIIGILVISLAVMYVLYRRSEFLSAREREFVAGVSHELRTPLSALFSAGENLAEGIVTNPGRIKEYGELVRREGARLTGMVERVLLYAGFQSERIKRNWSVVSLREIAESAVRRVSSINDHSINFMAGEESYEISGDAQSLRSMFENLLSNGLKHGESPVELKMTRQEKNGTILITVSDNGPGFSKKEVKKIFDPFYRGERSMEKQIPGSGVGLSLVQQIVKLHEGKITAENKPEGGALFRITFPERKRE
ncbi:MAG: sensor histidine kinase [Spirochaetia bacterium]